MEMAYIMSCMEPGWREEYSKDQKLFISFVLEVQSNLDYPDFFSGPKFFMNINKS